MKDFFQVVLGLTQAQKALIRALRKHVAAQKKALVAKNEHIAALEELVSAKDQSIRALKLKIVLESHDV